MKRLTTSRLLILAAMAWILLGTLVFFGCRHSDVAAMQYAGIILLTDSVVMVAVAYRCDATGKEKRWIRVEGFVDLLFSALLLLDPVFTFFVFPIIAGPWIVSRGLVTMIAAISLRKNVHGWIGDLIGGSLIAGCGILIFYNSLENPDGMNVLIGAIGWTIGLLYLYDAYRFRRINVTFHSMA